MPRYDLFVFVFILLGVYQCSWMSKMDVGCCEGHIVICVDLIVFLSRGLGFVKLLGNHLDPFGALSWHFVRKDAFTLKIPTTKACPSGISTSEMISLSLSLTPPPPTHRTTTTSCIKLTLDHYSPALITPETDTRKLEIVLKTKSTLKLFKLDN